MPLIHRAELAKWLASGGVEQGPPIFLFFGERYLCREAEEKVEQALLGTPADQEASGRKVGAVPTGVVHPIDGDQEDMSRTLGQVMSFSLLPGRQIYRVTDTRLFDSKAVASKIWEKALAAHSSGQNDSARQHLGKLMALARLEDGESLADLGAEQWRELLDFARPTGDLSWINTLLAERPNPQSKNKGRGASGEGATSIAERYLAALEKGLPASNFLLLSAENPDKRKALFLFIKKQGLIVDCSVDTKSSSAVAKKVQKEVLLELVKTTLASLQKSMEPRVVEMLCERVGFHPVAVVMELEKLALFSEDRPQITAADIELMTGRTREDALFELTEAFGNRQVAASLVILGRLRENGIHILAILATMRNYIRKLLLFRSMQLQARSPWQRGMSADAFQKNCLPRFKEDWAEVEALNAHPFAVYKGFQKAEEFSCQGLKEWLSLLLHAEYRLKGSDLPPPIILEELFFSLFASKKP